MAVHRGIPIVTDGLVINYDASTLRYGQTATPVNMITQSVADGSAGVVVNSDHFALTGAVGNGILTNTYPAIGNIEISLEIAFRTSSVTQPGTYAGLISGDDGDGGFGRFHMGGESGSSYVRFGFANSVGGANVEVDASAFNDLEAGDNLWYHYIGTYDGANLNLYRNGVNVATLASTAIPYVNAAPQIAVGNRPNTSTGTLNYFFQGDIAFARVYNKGLTSTEALYNWSIAQQRLNI